MRRRQTSPLASLLVVISMLFLAAPRTYAQTAKPKTVWDGAYSAEQAARGKAAYQAACAECHGADLFGAVPGAGSSGGGNAPALVGDKFIDRWREDNLVDLFTLIRSSMPRGGAGRMDDASKVDVFAYMLEANKFPAGTHALDVNAMETTLLVGKEGPKPLPSTTPVRTVGCLTRGQGNAWTLTNAAEPLRTQRVDETNDSEIRTSGALPLGTLTFRLPSLDYAIPGVRPTPFAGHKVQVKGIVYRQMNDNSITVRSLKSIAATCAP